MKLKCRLLGHKYEEVLTIRTDEFEVKHFECRDCAYVETTSRRLSLEELMQALVKSIWLLKVLPSVNPEDAVRAPHINITEFQKALYYE